LAFNANTTTKEVEWEGNTIPLKFKGDMQNEEHFNMIYHMAIEPEILKTAEERQSRILEADYSKVDATDYVHSLDYLSNSEKDQLIKLLQSHSILFGGGLGTLNVKPIHLEIQDGAKPYHARPFLF
jgi:hypothetical protein